MGKTIHRCNNCGYNTKFSSHMNNHNIRKKKCVKKYWCSECEFVAEIENSLILIKVVADVLKQCLQLSTI